MNIIGLYGEICKKILKKYEEHGTVAILLKKYEKNFIELKRKEKAMDMLEQFEQYEAEEARIQRMRKREATEWDEAEYYDESPRIEEGTYVKFV